jgi:DNA-binding CsgD family transcriptional regulator
MDDGAALDRLVQRAYGAAGDRSAWAEFLEAYAAAARCDGACLFHSPNGQVAASIAASVGIDAAQVLAFDQYYSKINPYAATLQRTTPGQVVALDSLLEPQEARTTEFYNDYVLPLRHHIAPTLALVFSGPSVVSTLGLFSTSARRGEVERLLVFQKRFVWHLQCALRLHHQLVALKNQVNDLLSAFDQRGVAVASVDARSCVSTVSAAAERIFARDDGLSCERGLLTAREARPVSLRRAIVAATRLADGCVSDVPSVLRVARQSEDAPDYELVICPVTERRAVLRGEGARALVFIFDSAQPATLNPALLLQNYGLTPAEARVVELLASGYAPHRIAQQLHVSRETVKSHLKMAYAKTGTCAQSELVGTLLRGVASLSGATSEVAPPSC